MRPFFYGTPTIFCGFVSVCLPVHPFAASLQVQQQRQLPPSGGESSAADRGTAAGTRTPRSADASDVDDDDDDDGRDSVDSLTSAAPADHVTTAVTPRKSATVGRRALLGPAHLHQPADSAALCAGIPGQQFLHLHTLLKKERLFVVAEKESITDLFMTINELTESLMQQLWLSRRQQWNLRLFCTNKISWAEWTARRLCLQQLNNDTCFVEAHSHFGPQTPLYEKFVRALRDDPVNLGRCLFQVNSQPSLRTYSRSVWC